MSPINYIRRKSENLTTVIEQIYGLKINNEPDKCLKVASETFSSLLNIDLTKILETDDELFLQDILKLNYTPDYIEALVKFMLETSEVYILLNKTNESMNLKSKSIKILQHLEATDKTYSDERGRLLELLKKQM